MDKIKAEWTGAMAGMMGLTFIDIAVDQMSGELVKKQEKNLDGWSGAMAGLLGLPFPDLGMWLVGRTGN